MATLQVLDAQILAPRSLRRVAGGIWLGVDHYKLHHRRIGSLIRTGSTNVDVYGRHCSLE